MDLNTRKPIGVCKILRWVQRPAGKNKNHLVFSSLTQNPNQNLWQDLDVNWSDWSYLIDLELKCKGLRRTFMVYMYNVGSYVVQKTCSFTDSKKNNIVLCCIELYPFPTNSCQLTCLCWRKAFTQDETATTTFHHLDGRFSWWPGVLFCKHACNTVTDIPQKTTRCTVLALKGVSIKKSTYAISKSMFEFMVVV